MSEPEAPKEKTRAAVAILIVTYNSAPDLPACFDAIARQDHRPLEIVVVDCESRDQSVEIAHDELAKITQADDSITAKVQPLGENRGFSGGMNAALRASTAPFVLALNADARPATDFIRHLLGHLEGTAVNESKFAAVTGRLVRFGADSERRLLDACGMYLSPAWRHFDRASGEPDKGQLMKAELVFGATGAATLYRRAALEDVALPGGEIFDELFHSYREDAELCFRFQERGWQVVYEPRAVAEHRRRVVPANRRQISAAINRHSLKNRYLLRAYHQTPKNILATLVPALGRDLAAFLFVLAFERTSLAAYAWLWRHRREIRERRRFIQNRRTAPPSSVERWFKHRSFPLEMEEDPGNDT